MKILNSSTTSDVNDYHFDDGNDRDISPVVAKGDEAIDNSSNRLGEKIYHLALHYKPVNHGYGLFLLRRSAEIGYPMAQSDLGLLHMDGAAGVDRNIKTGLYYLKRADKNNCAEASMHLGTIYELGQGVPKNLHRAIYCYRRAIGSDIPDVDLDIERVKIKIFLQR